MKKIKKTVKSSCTTHEKHIQYLKMIKKLTLSAGMIILVVSSVGCTATATVGKTANPPWFSVHADKDGANVTLPFVKAAVAPEKE